MRSQELLQRRLGAVARQTAKVRLALWIGHECGGDAVLDLDLLALRDGARAAFHSREIDKAVAAKKENSKN